MTSQPETSYPSWKHLELASPEAAWEDTPGRKRLLLLAVNMPGYYSLAVRILALGLAQNEPLARQLEVRYLEVDNTEDLVALAGHLAALRPDCLAWTVNIWNRLQVEELIRRLRPMLPQALFVCGGQEVTNSAVDFLALLPELDYCIEGEGEIALLQLAQAWLENEAQQGSRILRDPHRVSGLRFRDPAQAGKSVLTRPAELVQDLDALPSVILAGLVQPQSRNLLGVMLEGSRGCPNRCSFCFEGGRTGRVRSASVARLAEEAAWMAAQGAGYFHILDPILCNSNPARLRELSTVLAGLQARNPRTVISVEIYAHQVSEELAECLKSCSIVDVGLQSTHEPTVRAIHRAWQPERFKEGLARLRAAEVPFNIYLICGLPEETLATYLNGLISIMAEQPTRIFCNELCLLNGTELRHRALEYGYSFDQQPPYRAWSNRWMSAAEFTLAQAASKVVEKYYNLSSRAIHTKAPWLPSHAPRYDGLARIDVLSPCSHACPGCSRSAAQQTLRPENLASLLDTLEDRDVELVAGNGMDKEILIQLIGRLQLYAPARLRLVAPADCFADPAFVHTLVMRGVWHFRTFADVGDMASTDVAESLKQALANLCQTRSLTGFAVIRPYSELVLLLPQDADKAAAVYCNHLRELAASQPTMLSVPQAAEGMPTPWQEQLAAAFWDLSQNLCWLRLPKAALDLALAGTVSGDAATRAQVLAHLEQLGLSSTADNLPPCHFSAIPVC